MRFSPTTDWGWWSIALTIAFVILIAVFFVLVASGQHGPYINPLLILTIVPAGICALTSLVFGLIGVIGHQERSALVFGCLGIGLFVVIFVLGEILYPS